MNKQSMKKRLEILREQIKKEIEFWMEVYPEKKEEAKILRSHL